MILSPASGDIDLDLSWGLCILVTSRCIINLNFNAMSSYRQLLYHLVFRTKNSIPSINQNNSEQLNSYISGIIRNKNSHLQIWGIWLNILGINRNTTKRSPLRRNTGASYKLPGLKLMKSISRRCPAPAELGSFMHATFYKQYASTILRSEGTC